MSDGVWSGCTVVAGLILVVLLVVAGWMAALMMPGIGDIIRAFQ